ncbi:putative bifunctional diguanylate cyclase/phosphodiesterase [Paractinoplanes lichenicola]|uniref:putative bifunctional diguanylate cyclase/phosphodiesterase n=1 Tax=Paractinoplanes lichenicola TaxID=2802976 RepID=UPI001F2FB9F1|nr:bifunctional diguanylate cyclase/phosphodiesterase [Actinoplanes lichenicola]
MEQARLRLHRNALGVAGSALVLAGAAWLAVGLVHEWAYPILGWLLLPVSAGVASYAAWGVSRSAVLDPGTRRFWRHMALASALYVGGTISNTVDAVGGPEPSQRVGTLTMSWYLATMGVVIWALLRLPAWQRTRGDWVRFLLDSCVVLVAGAAFVWQFSIRNHQEWTAESGSATAVLVMVSIGLVAVVTLAKVAFAGAGRLDRRALHLLSAGSALSAAFGSLSPFLVDHPHLSSSFVAIPVGSLGVTLAAARQLRSGGRLPAPRRIRRISVVPYVAVVAMDALLLWAGGDSTAVRISTAVLTVLVMLRQVYALRENRRLLSTVDTSLNRLRETQDQLSYQATHDPLTGVGNRALFEETVDVLLATRAEFHVALLDMDDFKSVNDRLGHTTGDSLLIVVSRRLRAAVGSEGVVARLGGDEFTIVLRDVTDHRVDEILARVLTGLRESPRLGPGVRSVASVGVTTARAGDTGPDLLRRADVAMYEAKARGGDRRHWFDAEMDEQAQRTARLSADLLGALDRDEFFLLYQPIVELPSGRPAGVEVLLRWRHPEHGLVSPDVFIPLAERNARIVEIGRWVLENACRQAAEWQRRFGAHAPSKISINVSARQLAEPGFVAEVEQILARTGVDRATLLLEVTETAVLEAGAPLEAVRELRERGLRVALDDFGTGQSSLSLLLTVPVDVLKVDKSFVSGDAADHAGAVIVEHLIGFTNGLRIEAVAEGVETEDQANRLHAAGYSLAQGYLFGRPATAADIESRMAPAPVS